jgi:hypothetical protein
MNPPIQDAGQLSARVQPDTLKLAAQARCHRLEEQKREGLVPDDGVVVSAV